MKAFIKYIPLMLFWGSSLITTGMAQGISIVYDAQNKPDAMRRYMPERAGDKVNYRTSLHIANGQSKYSRDSVFVMGIASQGTEYWHYETIYKDYNRKLWLVESGRYREGHILQKDLGTLREKDRASQSWSITAAHKLIAGIDCIKAVSEHGDVAWYAPSIPYPDGPQYGVFNLPGLVMEYETELYKWVAVSVHFGKQEISLPEGEWSSEERNIERSYQEIMSLNRSESIVINAKTPLQTWIKFEQ